MCESLALVCGRIECLATSAVGEKNKLGTFEKVLGRLPRSFMSCEEGTGGFCLKSARGVYEVLPVIAPPSPLLKRLFIDQDVRTLHAMMTRATNAMDAPTMMKTKFSGTLVLWRYGAFAMGGTVGGG